MPNSETLHRRCGCQAVNMLNDDGTINAIGGPFAGLDR
jgi:hypothetical protein